MNQDSKLVEYLRRIKEGDSPNNSDSMNPLLTLMKDADGHQMAVFSMTDKEKEMPSVYFYDVELKREIGQALGAQGFLAYVEPQGDIMIPKLVFYRDLLKCILKKDEEYDKLLEENFRGGFPLWYAVDVDFRYMRT